MTAPHTTSDHPALVLLYSAGGVLALLAGLGLVYLGGQPGHFRSDTLPFDTVLGAVLAPLGALSVAGGVAMRWQWRSVRVWRTLPLMWLLGCGIGAVLVVWLIQ
jgi:hypothetical protein